MSTLATTAATLGASFTNHHRFRVQDRSRGHQDVVRCKGVAFEVELHVEIGQKLGINRTLPITSDLPNGSELVVLLMLLMTKSTLRSSGGRTGKFIALPTSSTPLRRD